MTNHMKGNPHALRAESFAEGINDWLGSEGVTDATMTAAAIDRQTEATLALAHEQRTANLIAYYALWNRIESAKPTRQMDAELEARLGLRND